MKNKHSISQLSLRTFFLVLGAFVCSFVAAQSDTLEFPQKSMKAVRITEPPKIDGTLDEAVWQQADVATDFIVRQPNPGATPTYRTEIRVIYDDQALYIGAFFEDPNPENILRQLSARDNDANADAFTFGIDTYDDDLNAFVFWVTAAGVQMDARESPVGYDESWNAVWESEISYVSNGWIVEVKMPYSALRFPKKDVQTWGINFSRRIRNIRETSDWNFMNPQVEGLINQFGELNGLENIEAPPRLAFFPYVSAYLEHFPIDDSFSPYSTSINGGMDVKYGINDAFTLDVTLVPDFGQVQSDNVVLNLSPFEVQFNENRQFFTEGTEIFNKGGLFYSRRIGGTPIGFYDVYGQLNEGDSVISNPSSSQLINATKLSGRTSGGLGIGILNAVSKEMHAVVQDADGNQRKIVTDPLTNYNVFVLDQSLKNNSFVSLANTNVMRAGHTYDANATALTLRIVDSTNTYAISANGRLTQQFGEGVADEKVLGHSYGVELSKVSGQVRGGVWHVTESDTYNPNDLGFLYNNNSMDFGAFGTYNIYEPFWKINSLWSEVSTYYSRNYAPNAFGDFNIHMNGGVLWKNFLATGLNYTIEPVETYDFFEPRVPGRFYTWGTSHNVGGFYSSDYRKKVAIDLNVGYRWFNNSQREIYDWEFSPRFRINDKLMIIPTIAQNIQNSGEGSALYNSGGATFIGDTIIFSTRDQVTWNNIISASYIFNSKMSLTFRARHYWSKVTYKQFHVLDDEGYLADLEKYGVSDNFDRDAYNNSFNVFNIDMVYSWVFAPGSNLSLVWKNSIFDSDNDVSTAYLNNLEKTFESTQLNSFSIKVLYYVDYLYLKRKNR